MTANKPKTAVLAQLLLQGYRMQKLKNLHPAVFILFWVSMTVAVQMLSIYPLVLLAGSVLFLSVRKCAMRFFSLLRRTRWILLSVLVIYSYTGHGTPLWADLGVLSPVTDGVTAGLVQLLRLLIVLASLSLLLSFLSLAQLVAGLYTLTRPLVICGLSRERFAVRLALTMSYAESIKTVGDNNWLNHIEHLLLPVVEMPGVIELKTQSFTWYDGLMLAMVLLMLAGVML